MTPLKRARKDQKLTIYQVAERAGVSAPTVSRVERNQQRCDPDTAEKLAQAVGITEEQILYPERFMNEAARAA